LEKYSQKRLIMLASGTIKALQFLGSTIKRD
jgi:hypothetical protein